MMPLIAPPRFLIDEIVLADVLALFLSIATVSILWYAPKKIFPDEVKDIHHCDCSVCNPRLLRRGCHKLQCDSHTA
jgi:hypothetical protein